MLISISSQQGDWLQEQTLFLTISINIFLKRFAGPHDHLCCWYRYALNVLGNSFFTCQKNHPGKLNCRVTMSVRVTWPQQQNHCISRSQLYPSFTADNIGKLKTAKDRTWRVVITFGPTSFPLSYLERAKVQEFPSFKTSPDSQVHVLNGGPVFPPTCLINCSHSPNTCCACRFNVFNLDFSNLVQLH